ncbi:MAG: coproporphyrinogen dehydrogenase HemZ [Lachnospiraceae bacterium]|nr:coproporphyrinogen dehydrogenase HemZ [Lachnospiraceae bacterium]
MKKNNIDINITGLDFRQDVEPLIKEFFPGFIYDTDVLIDIRTGEDEFEVIVTFAGENESCENVPADEKGACETVPAGETGTCGKSGSVKEKVVYTSEDDLKIRRRDYRNQLLRALYRLLSEATGKQLPWGILTGVRPTKLLFERIEKGLGKPLQFMEEKYYCSAEKASLAARVAALEYQLLDRIDYKHGYSLYVGIPFCPSICNYCTFGSHPIGKFSDLVEPYIEALCREIAALAGTYSGGNGMMPRKLETVYIGGGTPTALEADQLRRIIRCIRDHFDWSNVHEFTVEAGRPDSITEEKLMMLREENVGRISINPQSFSQKTLDLIGRNHTTEQVFRAFSVARELGFDNINMDLIAGLTGEDVDDFRYTLECVSKLHPESLTVHTLARKRAARLTTQPELYEEYSSGNVTAMLELAGKFTKENGYEPYYMYRQKNMTDNLENVGYSKPGRECLYNILIMEEVQPILALGAGASSKFVRETDGRFGRIENVKNVREYIERIDEMIERKTNPLMILLT